MPDWFTRPTQILVAALLALSILYGFGWWPYNDTTAPEQPVRWSPRLDTTWEAVARCELGSRADPTARLDELQAEYGDPDPRVLISTTSDAADCLDRIYP